MVSCAHIFLDIPTVCEIAKESEVNLGKWELEITICCEVSWVSTVFYAPALWVAMTTRGIGRTAMLVKVTGCRRENDVAEELGNVANNSQTKAQPWHQFLHWEYRGVGEPYRVDAVLDLPDQEDYRDLHIRGYNGILTSVCELKIYGRMIDRVNLQAQVDVMCNLDDSFCKFWINQRVWSEDSWSP